MNKYIYMLPLIAAFSLPAVAQEESTFEHSADEVTMDVLKQKRGRGHGVRAIKKLVAEYMLENGDITVEELQIEKEEKRAIKAELKELKESGDQEALQARIEELRVERAARREEVKAYIAEHEDLAIAIEKRKEEIKARRAERRQLRELSQSES